MVQGKNVKVVQYEIDWGCVTERLELALEDDHPCEELNMPIGDGSPLLELDDSPPTPRPPRAPVQKKPKTRLQLQDMLILPIEDGAVDDDDDAYLLQLIAEEARVGGDKDGTISTIMIYDILYYIILYYIYIILYYIIYIYIYIYINHKI